MEETIQNIFVENPYFAFAGFVAMVAVSLYIIKKLKNVIIGIIIICIALSIYLYRTNVISGQLIAQIVKAESMQEVKQIYHTFVANKKDEFRDKTRDAVINSLSEDIKEKEL